MKPALALTGLGAGLLLSACATQPMSSTGPDYGRTAVTPAQSSDPYYVDAQQRVAARAEMRNAGQAKNVILFVGDGMGVSTITAGRIYAGQQQGIDGESYRLTMETFPNVALSKTYAHDAQVSDSAATAVAMVSGVKTNVRTLGFTSDGQFGNCGASLGNEVDTLFEIAETAGLATGIVSTARITHATPASTYSNSPSRDWEDDTDLGNQAGLGCSDIAAQLIDWPVGDGFEVAMGGGRRHFMTNDTPDPELSDRMGGRADGRDLVADWLAKGEGHKFIYDSAGFANIDFASDVRVLGLFEPSHMQYELDRAGDVAGEPSLAELTTAAITRLSQDEDGYVLMIEGGRVDHGHHAGNAKRALEDTVALDAAIRAAVEATDADETLILVTADHSHTLTIAGYAGRGNPILGLSASGIGGYMRGADGKPYTTLGYANGPGAICGPGSESECERADLSDMDTGADNYQQQSTVPMGSETHGGEDVAIFAMGAGAERVGGVMEQNEIFFVLGQSLGLID